MSAPLIISGLQVIYSDHSWDFQELQIVNPNVTNARGICGNSAFTDLERQHEINSCTESLKMTASDAACQKITFDHSLRNLWVMVGDSRWSISRLQTDHYVLRFNSTIEFRTDSLQACADKLKEMLSDVAR